MKNQYQGLLVKNGRLAVQVQDESCPLNGALMDIVDIEIPKTWIGRPVCFFINWEFDGPKAAGIGLDLPLVEEIVSQT